MSSKKKNEFLRLTVSKLWFNLMLEGKTTKILKSPSKQLMSRITNADYMHVMVKDGYGSNSRVFKAGYLGFYHAAESGWVVISDKHSIKYEVGDVVLMCSSNLIMLRDEKSK